MNFLYFSFPGSAQLIFNVIKSVEYTVCNKTVIIPCFVTNVKATNISDMFVKWKFKGKDIFIYDGQNQNQMSPSSEGFKSTEITPSELLKGVASLKMDKSDACVGNYTCEVTELSREGETIIELKYRVGKTSITAFLFFFLQQPDPIRKGVKWD